MGAPPGIVQREHAYGHVAVDADGLRIVVVDDGPRSAQETLLFLHGNPAWSFLWRKLLAPAIAAGHRVVAPDMAGFGRSDKPEDPAYYSLARHIRNLELVAESLDLRGVTLVLHDWGGPVGMGFAARQPQRVRRIVVANTAAFAPTKARAFTAWHRWMGTRLGYEAGVRANLVAWTAFKWGVEKPLPREVRAAYAWPLREKGGRVAAARMVQLVPDGPGHPSAETLREAERGYAKLQDRPMLVLWADKDPVMGPGLAERWRRSFPAADVRHLSQGGHFWQEDDPEPFTRAILDFCRGPKA